MRLALAILLLAPLPVHAAPSIFGRWITDDRSAVIRIEPCGKQLCGTIERVLNPKAPVNDIYDPDPVKRSHPLVGTAVLTGFIGAGTDWDGGTAYDPKAGKTYRSRLKLESAERLRVTGCVWFVCRSLIWTRAG